MSLPKLSLRRLALALVLLLLVSCVLLAHVQRQGQAAMAQSDEAFHRGELSLALDRARDAAGWYFPAAPHVEHARERLAAIALGAEASGRSELGRRAWTALRGSLLETEHPGSQHAEALALANRHVARLLAAEVSRQHAMQPTASELEAQLGQTTPRFEGRLLAGLGLLAMLLAVWGLCSRQLGSFTAWNGEAARGLFSRAGWVLVLGGGMVLWVWSALGT